MSLLLQSPDIFTNEAIIDELLDFMIAGTTTSSLVTQTMLGHFATTKSSLQKARNELEKRMQSEYGLDEKANTVDALKKYCPSSFVSDLDHLNNVMKEALRLQPPVLTTMA